MKNIVLLSDGTGNSAAKLFKTNVWRTYQALDLTDEKAQIAFYDDGVGTSSFRPMALLGGAVGYGLKRNVLDIYGFLCRNYRDGDRIFCFGFSRGAYTVRILTGLVNNQGLVVAETEEALAAEAERAFREYRNRYHSLVTHVARRMPKLKREKLPRLRPKIAFVGVWDTVAAYGLPIDEATKLLSYVLPLSIPDRNPCPIMERGCHALALDDERKTFHPVLWNEAGLVADARHSDQEVVTQVWFAGAHSDVGGGYAEDALSYASLDWIMGEAGKKGLRFDPETRRRMNATMNVNGMLHDPRKGTGAAYRYLPRDVYKLTNDEHNRVLVARPKIHESVFRRIEHSDDSYAPIVLPARYAVMDGSGAIHDLPAQRSGLPLSVRETRAEAADRVAKQKARLSGLIRSRKILHSASMLVLISLALFPWVFTMKSLCDSGIVCGPERAIAALLSAVLPDFLARWLDAYAVHWEIFLVHVLALWLILRRSTTLQERIKDRMRKIWMREAPQPSAPSGEAVAADA